ncbi:Uncharacterised protein [Chlamydia abortus]|nr:Uncharacterised protein [Chlamydia abortus]SGA22593.1 Uncharacterised protein [Chlamydia abortus]SGA22657.1 Uncharacterised protein [Chlamydia abortus]SGA26412.1 Uncharacterised protein [Chlamydia abortus]SGA30855.1 Uncharacterised protein [Chlamydia abortus]
MESKGNRQMVALSSPPLPFQERKPGLPGFAVSLHDERGCVEGMPDSKRGCRRLGLDQRHLEGRKGKAGQRGPFSPLLPSLPAVPHPFRSQTVPGASPGRAERQRKAGAAPCWSRAGSGRWAYGHLLSRRGPGVQLGARS